MENLGLLQDKRREIRDMFSRAASYYDLLNRTLSFGRDAYWRRVAVKKAEIKEGELVLDLATGTGDLAIEVAKRVKYGVRIVGVDICRDMLQLAQKKVEREGLIGISFQEGASEALPFRGDTFDVTLVAFGIRNFASLSLSLKELHRVLKGGGRVVVLEFTRPKNCLPWLYIRYLLPLIGYLISGNRAYQYLPDSISNFLTPAELKGEMAKVGFKEIETEALTLGVCMVYLGVK